MKNTKLKKVSELQIGDKVITETGGVITIVSMNNGFYRNSTLLNYTNGESSCILNNSEVKTII